MSGLPQLAVGHLLIIELFKRSLHGQNATADYTPFVVLKEGVIMSFLQIRVFPQFQAFRDIPLILYPGPGAPGGARYHGGPF